MAVPTALQQGLVAGREDVELGKGELSATQKEINSADVVLFVMPGCIFCAKAEAKLKEHNITYKTVDLALHKAEIKNLTGKTSAPSTWVKGTYIGGCNDGTKKWHGVVPMLENGKLQGMLKGLDPELGAEPDEEAEKRRSAKKAVGIWGTVILFNGPLLGVTLLDHWYISVINFVAFAGLAQSYKEAAPAQRFNVEDEAKAIKDLNITSGSNKAIRWTMAACHVAGAFGLLWRNRAEALGWQALDTFRFMSIMVFAGSIATTAAKGQ